MAQSLSNILVHIVFSTKGRKPSLRADIRPRLKAYVGGISRRFNCPVVALAIVDDHVHLLVVLARDRTVATLVRQIKLGSSHWLRHNNPQYEGFAWQRGYGAFSVSESNCPAVVSYINDQLEHHKAQSFQAEYRGLLDTHGVDFDERHLWN